MSMLASARSLLHLQWRHRFFNRLFFFNAAIFIVVVYSFGLFASILTTKLDINSHLQSSKETLTAICDEYNRKHDNFYNIILPLYNSADNYETLSEILEGSAQTDKLGDPYFKQRVVKLMQILTVQDRDIIAILLHRKSDGADFLYSVKSQSFTLAPASFPYFEQLKAKDPFGRAVYGVDTWGSAAQVQRAYGIAGSMGTQTIRRDAGSIMVAYDVTSLHRLLQKHNLPGSGRFYIVSVDGDVIFDSTMQLYGSRFPQMDLVSLNDTTVMIDGVKSIVQTIDHANRRYYGLYIETDAAINAKIANNRGMIFGICTGVSLLSALLYMVAGMLSTRRVRELEHAMEHIGSNNLSYRLPLTGAGDEFEYIAKRFNMMCDELQGNINKLYINEIRQKNAELSALQSGINPHFLYNTLEAIRSKAYEDGNKDVAEFIVLMASLLRNLVRSQTFIPVRQEMDFCRMYLDMFTLRHADRFSYTTDISPDVLGYGVPKGMLQPVLENYFVHGIHEDAFDNRLVISGRLEGSRIVFEVQDNGKGLDAVRLDEIRIRLESMDTSHTTFGLANVHERIRLVFGSECGLSLESEVAVRTCVTVHILAQTCEELAKNMMVSPT